MSIQDPHATLLNSDEFKRITAKKHRVSVILFCITMAMFLAIPLLSHFAPEFQKRSLVGSMNIGLGFILFQYAAGSVIAIIYTLKFRKLDRQLEAVVRHHIGSK